jgi:hypothetical protein
MRTLKSKSLIIIIWVFLGVASGLSGCANPSTPVAKPPGADDTLELTVKQNNIVIHGAITHVYEPDNSSKTMIDIVIGKEFTGTLPDDIDTITVTGPKGDLTFGKGDFNYYPQFRDFWISMPGAPEKERQQERFSHGHPVGYQDHPHSGHPHIFSSRRRNYHYEVASFLLGSDKC